MVLTMKNKIFVFLKKVFNYIRKHFTNFLLGIIIFILLVGLYNLSPNFKVWVLGAKYKITGQRHKTEIIGKVKYVCSEFDLKAFLEKSRLDNAGKSTRTLEEIRQYRKENESQFYKNTEKYTNVIRSSDWVFFIFKTYEKISFYPKMDETECKCIDIDASTNKCIWTELEKPIPTGYLFEKDR